LKVRQRPTTLLKGTGRGEEKLEGKEVQGRCHLTKRKVISCVISISTAAVAGSRPRKKQGQLLQKRSKRCVSRGGITKRRADENVSTDERGGRYWLVPMIWENRNVGRSGRKNGLASAYGGKKNSKLKIAHYVGEKESEHRREKTG